MNCLWTVILLAVQETPYLLSCRRLIDREADGSGLGANTVQVVCEQACLGSLA